MAAAIAPMSADTAAATRSDRPRSPTNERHATGKPLGPTDRPAVQFISLGTQPASLRCALSPVRRMDRLPDLGYQLGSPARRR